MIAGMNLENALQPVIEKDDLLFQDVLKKHDTAVREILVQSPYPMTGRAVFMFYLKSSFLKNAILAICQNEDSYSTKILYRSYIEHYLRHRYILYRFFQLKSDEPGKNYYQFAMLEEGIRFLYGVNKGGGGEDTVRFSRFRVRHRFRMLASTPYLKTVYRFWVVGIPHRGLSTYYDAIFAQDKNAWHSPQREVGRYRPK